MSTTTVIPAEAGTYLEEKCISHYGAITSRKISVVGWTHSDEGVTPVLLGKTQMKNALETAYHSEDSTYGHITQARNSGKKIKDLYVYSCLYRVFIPSIGYVGVDGVLEEKDAKDPTLALRDATRAARENLIKHLGDLWVGGK